MKKIDWLERHNRLSALLWFLIINMVYVSPKNRGKGSHNRLSALLWFLIGKSYVAYSEDCGEMSQSPFGFALVSDWKNGLWNQK